MRSLESEVRLNMGILDSSTAPESLRIKAESRLIKLKREFDKLEGWAIAERDADFVKARELLRGVPTVVRCDCCGQRITQVNHRGDLVLGPECVSETELHSCKKRD